MSDVPVVNLLKQLMDIPSVSEEEKEIGLWLADYLKSVGLTVEMIPIAPGSDRCNVYAYMGRNRKARTMLTSHMDTVPPHIPITIKDNIIYGRGACDDKGPLAAQIIAVEELKAEGALKDGDVSLLFVVGEEKGGPGMLAANDMNLTWEGVIFGEPTEGKLATGHKGHFVFELFAKGVPCHSGYPEQGKSATGMLVSLLEELRQIELPVSDLLGPTTFHCGKIQGGVAYNVVAAEAYALCGIRIASSLQDIETEVEATVAKYPDVTFKKSFSYPETLLDYEVEGLERMSVSFGTDCPRLKGSHRKYLYGPGSILDAHGENEHVKIPDLIESSTMAANIADAPTLPRDEAFAITADFNSDPDPGKISLGAGVYRDEKARPWVLPSIKAAKRVLEALPDFDNHEYLPILGFEPFLKSARELILGDYDISKSHTLSVQTLSGTGANHLGALFLGKQLKPRNVFISDPTWGNHFLIWQIAAPDAIQKKYPYYRADTCSFDFNGMVAFLENGATEGDVVILHSCAHNPTGIDPTRDQWRDLAQLFKKKKLVPFFDSAYQGFATGDVEDDAWAVRHFQKVLFQDGPGSTPQGMCIAQSFAKNMGLYGERVGAFHLILPRDTPATGPQSQLMRLVRAEISNPPLYGARLVYIILSDPQLRDMWKEDLRTMSGRIKRVRTLLRQEIDKHEGLGDWGHLTSQIGMFSYTGLSKNHVQRLRDEHHIYLMYNGRASLSGANVDNVKYIADAIAEVVQYYKR
ncbi:aspartate aminotransferase [Fusarium pseudoanthophilum]|uniref:Aspartate aminotransferase n=1 Tax=Fusarium pseudoanthophilum TaxID=48495 RepID=A0A8H5NWF2_9HYPO|nr:aspartate aminotransferase [Fusarium pseudoanthophilum]